MQLAKRLVVALGLGLALSAFAATSAAEEPHAEPSGALAAEHGSEHGHVPHLEDVNWYYGVLGEKEGVEPSLWWRRPGTPVPYAALLFNTLILFAVLYRFAKKPVSDALAARKAALLRGMDEAAKMKREAEERLQDYEDKLAHIDDEVERVHRELRQTGEHERARILAEAEERRARMEREARVLIEQELKAWREILFRETVRGAVRSAESAVTSKISASDQERLAEEYLAGLKSAASSLRSKL